MIEPWALCSASRGLIKKAVTASGKAAVVCERAGSTEANPLAAREPTHNTPRNAAQPEERSSPSPHNPEPQTLQVLLRDEESARAALANHSYIDLEPSVKTLSCFLPAFTAGSPRILKPLCAKRYAFRAAPHSSIRNPHITTMPSSSLDKETKMIMQSPVAVHSWVRGTRKVHWLYASSSLLNHKTSNRSTSHCF